MKQLTLAEVVEAQEVDLGSSPWLTIEQPRIDQFAEATEDRQWIHVDAERAKDTEIGSTIAHGFLVLSLLPKLFFDLVEFTDMERMINYGTDKVRFISPVPAGGEVRLSAHILSARRRLGGILMRIRGQMYLRATERRVLVTEMLFLAFPRENDGECDVESAAEESAAEESATEESAAEEQVPTPQGV